MTRSGIDNILFVTLLGTLVILAVGCEPDSSGVEATVEMTSLTGTALAVTIATQEAVLHATQTQEAIQKGDIQAVESKSLREQLGNVSVLALALGGIILVMVVIIVSLILWPLRVLKEESVRTINAEAQAAEDHIRTLETKLWQQGKGPNPFQKPPLAHDARDDDARAGAAPPRRPRR